MLDLAKLGRRGRADPLSGRVRGHEVRALLFDGAELTQERVVLAVADERRVEDVVAVVVEVELLAERVDSRDSGRVVCHACQLWRVPRASTVLGLGGAQRS